MNSLIVCDLYLTPQAELVSEKHWSAYNINYSAKVNTPQTISFSIPNSSPHIEHVINNNIVVFKDERYIIRDTTINKDDNTITEVSCEHLSSQLTSRINGKFDFKAETINTLVGKVLEGTSWSLGETDIASSNLRHLISTNETILSNLITIAETFGAVCLFTSTKAVGNKVNFYVNKIQRETYLTNTKNIKSISLKYDSNDMVNRIHVFGKVNKTTGIETSIVGITGGKTYVEDFSYYLNQGYTQEYINANLDLFLREGELRLSEIDDAQKLYDMAIEELDRKKNPVLNCTVSVLDLSGIPKYFMEQPKLYESVVIRDTELNLDLEATVVGFSKNYDDDLDMTLDISSVIEYSSFMKDVIDKVDKSETDLIEVDKGWKDVIEEAKNTATDLINSGLENSNVIVRQNEILVMNTTDTSTATEVWRWNKNGLGYATSYNGQFGLALTKDGAIVADRITVGTLNAQIIKTGLLSSLNNVTWINMDNGNFSFANKITYDGSNLNVNVDKLQIKSSDVATQTQLTTTANGLSTSISNVDGRVNSLQGDVNNWKFITSNGNTNNLLKNSAFNNPTDYTANWFIGTYNGMTGSINTIGNTTWSFPDKSINTIQINCSNQSNGEYGIRQTVSELIVGRKYTLGFYTASHRINSAMIVIRSTSSSTTGWLTSKTLTNGGNGTGGVLSEWTYTTISFTAQVTSHVVEFNITNAGNNGILWIAKPMLVESDVDLPWGYANGEVYTGITTIGENGVTVSHTQSNTYSTHNADGFKVYKNTGEEIASFGENNKAIIGTLEADVVNAGNVIPQLRDKGDLSIYVGQYNNGDGSGSSWENACNSVITALTNLFSNFGIDWDSRGGMILTNTNITVNIWGSNKILSENVYLKDFLGEGLLKFSIVSDFTLTGKWSFRNCNNVEVSGGGDLSTNNGALFKRNGSVNGIDIYGCTYVKVYGCRFYNSSQVYTGIVCGTGSNVQIRDCDFYGFNQAINSISGGNCSAYNNRGHGQGRCSYYATEGGLIQHEGNRPNSSTQNATGGTVILCSGKTETGLNSIQVSPPPPTNTSVTQSFKPVSYKSVRSYNTETGSLKQGCYDTSKGNFTGYIEFGNKISDWCSDAVGGISGTITLQRMNDGHGYSGQIPVVINGTQVGTLAHGEKKTFNIPSSVLDGLKTGSRININLNGTGQSQYIKFETNVIVNITATKPI